MSTTTSTASCAPLLEAISEQDTLEYFEANSETFRPGGPVPNNEQIEAFMARGQRKADLRLHAMGRWVRDQLAQVRNSRTERESRERDMRERQETEDK